MDNHDQVSHTIDLSDLLSPNDDDTIYISNNMFPDSNIGAATCPNVWTTSSGSSGTWTFDSLSIITPSSGKLTLEGEDADIEINGRSLMQILDGIEQRLGLLKTHESMEAEWHELRAIGDQYREKLCEIEEKNKMWQTLKG